MIRKLLYLQFLLFVNLTFAQIGSITPYNDVIDLHKAGMWVTNNGTKDPIEGSPYLFDTWNNISKVFFQDRVYSLTSFNYNILRDRFEAKLSEDSVLVINTNNIKQITINNVVMKPYYDGKKGKISFFEEVASFNHKVLLKKFEVKIKVGSFNPMTQKQIKPDIYVKDEEFYLKKDEMNDLESIKLNKSSILNLIDPNYQEEIKTYAKKNNLKYNRILDVNNILHYYKSISI